MASGSMPRLSEVDDGILPRIEQVVALVLRIAHAEVFADELGRRMDLKAQVPAAHRIQKIETDGEILAEARLDRLAEQRTRPEQNQVDRWKLEQLSAYPEIEAVLLRHAVEAPPVIGLRGVQLADLLHPLSAPGGRVEERNHPERARHRLLDSSQEGIPVDELRPVGAMGVQPVVDPVEEAILVAVADSPVVEIAALVLQRNGFGAVVYAQGPHLMAAEALLELPARHIRIDQRRLG